MPTPEHVNEIGIRSGGPLGPHAHSPVTLDVVEQPISAWRRLYENGTARKVLLLVVLALIWEGYARSLDNSLLFPTLSATVAALAGSIADGELPRAVVYTLTLLAKGYLTGLALAALLTAFASVSRIGADLLETLPVAVLVSA